MRDDVSVEPPTSTAFVSGGQDEVFARCVALARSLGPVTGMLTTLSPKAAVAKTTDTLAALGLDHVVTKDLGRACLSTGYNHGNMRMAPAAALALAGSGQGDDYARIGHHVALRLGTLPNLDNAAMWYAAALDEIPPDGVAPGSAVRRKVLQDIQVALSEAARASTDTPPSPEVDDLPEPAPSRSRPQPLSLGFGPDIIPLSKRSLLPVEIQNPQSSANGSGGTSNFAQPGRPMKTPPSHRGHGDCLFTSFPASSIRRSTKSCAVVAELVDAQR